MKSGAHEKPRHMKKNALINKEKRAHVNFCISESRSKERDVDRIVLVAHLAVVCAAMSPSQRP